MASQDPFNYSTGNTRHAASIQSQLSDPRPIQSAGPVGTFSSPAGHGQSWVSTGSILNTTRRGRRSGPSGIGGLSAAEGPLSGLADSINEIIEASGVKRERNPGGAIAQDGRFDPNNPGWATGTAPTDADAPGPVSTGNPASNPDHPLMANLRSGQPRAAAALDFIAE